MCAKLDNMTNLIQRKCEEFVDQLIGDGRFTNLLCMATYFTYLLTYLRFISSFNAFCNNVERNFFLSTKSKQIKHVQFVLILSKGRNFVRHCRQKRQQCRSNIRHCRKNRSTCSSIRQCCWCRRGFYKVACCFDIVAGLDGA